MQHTARDTVSLSRHRLRRFIPAALLLAATLFLMPTGASAGDGTSDAGATSSAARVSAMIELGRRLFFDPAASPSGRRSCASCHDPEHGFSDPKRLSADDFSLTTRHSQTILDGANNPSAHWDGEFATVEALVRRRVGTRESPWGAPAAAPTLPEIELEPAPWIHRMPLVRGPKARPRDRWRVRITDRLAHFLYRQTSEGPGQALRGDEVAVTLESPGHYAEAFGAAFGSGKVTIDRIARAIGAYCKTVTSTEAPIDRFLAGDERALGPAAKRGLGLFRGRAGCTSCHTMQGERPAFTDYGFRNTGIAWSGVRRHYSRKQIERLGLTLADPRLSENQLLGDAPNTLAWLKALGGPVQLLADRGGGAQAGSSALYRTFKTPTLRDVAKRPPYMHDGSLKSLEAVVRYYAQGCCGEDPTQDKHLTGFKASDKDVEDLVAFLHALSGDRRPGLAPSVWPERVPSTLVRILGVRGEGGMRNAQIVLTEEGDLLPVRDAARAPRRHGKTDETGWLEFSPGRRTHVRVRLLGDGDPQGGLLIPDSSRRVDVRMHLAGRMTVTVRFPASAEAPEMIRFRHRGRSRAEDNVTTGLCLTAVEPLKAGWDKVTYEGWVRKGLSAQVDLDIPDLVDPLRADKRARISFILRLGESMHLNLKSYGWRKK